MTEYGAYLFFPATLAAGPLMTLPQLRASAAVPGPTFTDCVAGVARVLVGVVKKCVAEILLAKAGSTAYMGLLADPVNVPVGELWSALLLMAPYAYLDFSGYSDVAIGAGRAVGVRVPENFDFPFLRTSMRGFWRAWHMSLSTWVSKWVHFFVAYELRQSHAAAQTTVPVVVTFACIGLWHGAQLTWLMWGLHHATGVLIGDLVSRFRSGRAAPSDRAPRRVLAALAGIAFVWFWVGLSHAFTLASAPATALTLWWRAFTLAW